MVMEVISLEALDEDLRDNNYPPAILARVIFLKYLKFTFYGREVGNLKYDPDDQNTEILIKDYWKKEDAIKQKIPTIILARTPMVPISKSLGYDMTRYDVTTDTYHHARILTLSIIFHCISSNIIESEFIASIVFSMLTYFRKQLKQLGLVGQGNPRMDPPEPIQTYPTETQIEGFSTNIGVQIFLAEKWADRPKTDTEMREYQERTGVDPRGYNKPLNEYDDASVDISTD